MKNKYSWCLGVVLLSSMSLNSGAIAAPVRGKKVPQKTTTSRNSYRNSDDTDFSPANRWNEKKFYLFGGLDLGFGSYSKSALDTDASRSGLSFGIRGLAAYYSKQWVVDGGLGFQFLLSSGTNTANTELKVNTRTLYLDLSPRYRLNQKWQIGPELQYWLGTDNGLNSSIFSTASNAALMGGLQLIYEWQHENEATKYRFGGRWNTDFNISERNLNVFQIFFQIGFSPGGGSNDDTPRYTEELKQSDLEQVEPEPMPAATPPPAEEPVTADPEPEVFTPPPPAEEPAPLLAGPQEKMVMTLDLHSLPFESDSARLPKYNRDRVKEIGRFLGEQKDQWDRLVVSGHTDEQGKKDYNMKLSKARADTVRQLLGEGGAPISKIKTVGYGPNRPIAKGHSKTDWAKNRRVELEFFGVKDGLVIQKAFKK